MPYVGRATVETEAWYICGDLDPRPRLALIPHRQIGRPVDMMSTHTNDGIGVGDGIDADVGVGVLAVVVFDVVVVIIIVIVVVVVIAWRSQRRSSFLSWLHLSRTKDSPYCDVLVSVGVIDPSTVAAGSSRFVTKFRKGRNCDRDGAPHSNQARLSGSHAAWLANAIMVAREETS